MLRFLFPRIVWRQLPFLLTAAALGGLVAGIYGILHDQLTWMIAPEYFTRLKFQQFAWANIGLPERGFVALIGFLASWWAGLVAGWFLARMDPTSSWKKIWAGFAWVMASAILGGLLGWWWGVSWADLPAWQDYKELGVTDLPAFVRVACIHNGSYAGALFGLIIALLSARTKLKMSQP